MRLYLSTILFLLIALYAPAQKKMKPVGELINARQPGWQIVKAMIDTAKNKVEILPCDPTQARDALYKTQVTTNSPMGAIVYMTGGLLVDNGWIRILGSGNTKLTRTLPGWNVGKTDVKYGSKPAFYLVADDAVGGFFALNGGGLGPGPGKIYYLAPDDLVLAATLISFMETSDGKAGKKKLIPLAAIGCLILCRLYGQKRVKVLKKIRANRYRCRSNTVLIWRCAKVWESKGANNTRFHVNSLLG